MLMPFPPPLCNVVIPPCSRCTRRVESSFILVQSPLLTARVFPRRTSCTPKMRIAAARYPATLSPFIVFLIIFLVNKKPRITTMRQFDIFAKITKPNLVNFLRICDKERLTVRRIRYASIRSKGSLIRDIMNYFQATFYGTTISILSKYRNPRFAPLGYCTDRRTFLRDGVPFDCEIVSRKKPQYSIEYKDVTLHFGQLFYTRGRGTGRAAAGASWFA